MSQLHGHETVHNFASLAQNLFIITCKLKIHAFLVFEEKKVAFIFHFSTWQSQGLLFEL